MCFSGENGCLNQVERNDLHVHDVVFVSESWEKVHRTVKPVYKGPVYSGDPVYYILCNVYPYMAVTSHSKTERKAKYM